MTQTKFVFSYTETRDFEEPLEITMEVPERSIDEMCEYFQRFLTAAGYLFENNEKIRCSADKAEGSGYSGCGGDVLSFNTDGSPFVYDFGDGNNMNCFGGTMLYGATGNDTIKI